MAIDRAQHDIQIYRGDTPKYRYKLTDIDENGVEKPIDITGYQIDAHVRYSPDSHEIWFTLPIVKTDPLNGVFEWQITKEASQQLLEPGAITPDTAVYDIQITLGDNVYTFLFGSFSVIRDITRTY
ncbi:phage baseplate upper protein [Vibrio fluvialis]|uniref:phage baseplate upper protein n=1 Tax=Vibrio fluvialis TaxID=676 RepID=UPI001EECC526|nr:phage baseplate upper protein [Vibrio fluvialis]MCG6410397.1 phage baseplate upper protein [Vibrio fluvialis]